MKSPWQFISDLAARRRKRLAEEISDRRVDDVPDRLLMAAPVDQPEDVATNADARSEASQSAIPTDESLRNEVQPQTRASLAEPLRDAQEANRSTPVAPQTSRAMQTRTAPKRNARTARAAKPASRRKPDVPHASDELPGQLPVKRSFYEEVRSVDDDIQRLRTELAEKLRLQNEQLKKMLARFYRP